MTLGRKAAIIGAGASGLAAAISAARAGCEVTVFEHKPEAGLKLRLTGHGKCNLTHSGISAADYHAPDSIRLQSFLDRFDENDAISFFDSIGLAVHQRNGYYYPLSDKAGDVVDALVSECRRLGVEFIMNCGDQDILRLCDRFNSVILACGSSAYKKTGSNGSGYRFLQKLGVPYTRILPALCPVYVEENEFCEINSGRRIIAAASVICDGELIAEDTGEVQVKQDCLTGIPVMNISRYVSAALDAGRECSLRLYTAPDQEKVPVTLRGRYTAPVDRTVSFRVSRMARFDHAQVCMGGVPLDELTDGFGLKRVPGVYVTGEMCDVDGICGGYNLHWAWLSGNLCGK